MKTTLLVLMKKTRKLRKSKYNVKLVDQRRQYISILQQRGYFRLKLPINIVEKIKFFSLTFWTEVPS